MAYYGYPKYVSVAEKRAKAEKKLKQLRKKNPDIKPVIIEGNALAKTWWGKAWNKNLEKYADYSNRIGRGRSYVRHSAVLDLQIRPGEVTALVQGSTSKPYSVSVNIKAMEPRKWLKITQACLGQMESMQELVAGKFPKELAEIFTEKGKGLFPAPNEIDFNCSCPDWAYMCKHVAATLYGIGARLDDDPHLFFLLRKVNVNDLISETVKESKKELLSKSKKKSARVIEDNAALTDLFGIELGGPEEGLAPEKPLPKKSKNTTKTKAKKSVKAAPSKKIKTPAKKISKQNTIAEEIETIIKKHKKSISFPEIMAKTNFEDQQVRNIIYRLKQEGKISIITRGVYQWKRSSNR